MEPLAHRLRDAGYDAFNLGYASTRDTIDQHARTASEVVNRLGDYRLTHFVGHSMGNLVLRRMFARFGDRGRSWGRAVMLGPPNLGSKLAAALHRTPLAGNVLRRVMGRSALRLATWDDPHDFAGVKGMPVEVGVIAGRFERIPNPIIGEGDFIVGVEETRLDGAQHLTLPGHHTLLMRDTAAVEQTLHFLAEGRFAST
jgi:pimeloyl-ACP methyl ester carboxylesterase